MPVTGRQRRPVTSRVTDFIRHVDNDDADLHGQCHAQQGCHLAFPQRAPPAGLRVRRCVAQRHDDGDDFARLARDPDALDVLDQRLEHHAVWRFQHDQAHALAPDLPFRGQALGNLLILGDVDGRDVIG